VRLVHTNSLKSDLLGGIAARLAGVRVVWHVRDRIAEDYLPAVAVRGFRFLCRVIPHHVVTISQATLKTIIPDPNKSRAIRRLAERTDVVYDGTPLVPLNSFRAASEENKAPLIGLVGRISRWKGQHIFIEAAAIVLQTFPSARFQIIGDALFAEQDYAREVRQLARSLKLENQIEFTGFRSDVSELIARLDILIHASITGEPFGQVVIEGMVAGKPVVATNGGGIPEIVVDGVTGLLVPMNDARALAASIGRLISFPHEAGKLGYLGRQLVIDKFTSVKTAENMQALLSKVVMVR
jgi:glycosyltransferase involved in cell wall biosynthesis